MHPSHVPIAHAPLISQGGGRHPLSRVQSEHASLGTVHVPIPQSALSASSLHPSPRPGSLTSAPTTSVDAHLLGPGCQGRAPRHHLGPPPPSPSLLAQSELEHATIKSKAGGRKEGQRGREAPSLVPSQGNSRPPTRSRPQSPAQNGDDKKAAGALTTIHLLRERALAGLVYWSPPAVGQPWPTLIGKRRPLPYSP